MSVTSVFKRAFQKREEQTQSAKSAYRELLLKHGDANSDQWSKADEAKLFQLITELGITESKAMADATTLATMDALQQLASQVASASIAYDRASQAQSEMLAERQASALRMNAKCAVASGECESAMDLFQRCHKASGLIAELKAENPHLFGE